MGRRARLATYRYCILFLCFIIFAHGMAFGRTASPAEVPENEFPAVDAGQTSVTHSTASLDTEFSLTTGIRTDNLDWSISGSSIDVLSELTWTDVQSMQFSVGNRTRLKNNIYVKGQFNYAAIFDGKIQDSDYGSSGRRNEWSRSVSASGGDEAWDFIAGGGYTFLFKQRRLAVSPMLGVSVHKQNLRIHKGRQVVSETNPFDNSMPPAPGPLSNELNSSYFARWIGPWIGCDLSYKPKMHAPVYHSMELRLSMAVHWAEYSGEGNWNLRGDLEHPKSFEHEADGVGISVGGQCLINMADQWNLALTVQHQDWSTGSGTDRKFLSSGGTVTTQLNEVNWNSTSFMIGAAYRF